MTIVGILSDFDLCATLTDYSLNNLSSYLLTIMALQYRQKIKKLLSQEQGYVLKNSSGKISVVLVYPNSYHVGMSNLGFHKIYATLNKLDYVACERAFLPSNEDISLLKKTKTSIISMESQKFLNQFDIIAFSITFEMDYLHMLKILKLSRVALRRNERKEKDPLILVGGVCPTFNPEPIANFIDIAIIGEGEEVICEAMERFNDDKNLLYKKDLINALKGIEGIYIPEENCENEFKTGKGTKKDFKVKRRWLKNLDRHPTSTSIVTDQTIFGDMFLVETGKGCNMKCKFCETGSIYLPFRRYSSNVILKEIQKGKKFRNKIGLVGSAICDHPEIESILSEMRGQGLSYSVSSLRLNKISLNLLKLLQLGNCKTISVAPEAGSERLRKLIDKNLTDDKLYSAFNIISESGIKNLRLYYLIGLPGENDEDVFGIIKDIKLIKDLFQQSIKKSRSEFLITASINAFVPKPMTPFQREAMEAIPDLKRKLKLIKKGLINTKNIKIINESPKFAYIQTLLSRGDKNVGNLLYKTLEQNGDWFGAIKELDFDSDRYVYRKFDNKEYLPWDFLELG